MTSDVTESEMVSTIADVSRSLQQHATTQAVWDAVVRLLVETVPPVEHAGITIVRRGRPLTPAASSELPGLVDALQYRYEQGPCLDAIVEHDVFRTGDLALEHQRWPEFGPRAAAETGVRSMAAMRLFVGPETMGSLNLYSTRVDAFDDDTLVSGRAFAAHAALALDRVAQYEKSENLQHALETSRQIGTAVGILMSHRRITEPQAFQLLKEASQNSNRKLREVADDVLVTGTLPDPPIRRPAAHRAPGRPSPN